MLQFFSKIRDKLSGRSRGTQVEIRSTEIGDGVFALRKFEPRDSVGLMTGIITDDDTGWSEYSIDMGDDFALVPDPPFRFLNHSCDPNCQLVDWESGDGQSLHVDKLDVAVRRTILPGEEITIDYAWPASAAIECRCGSESCRGWIVDESELDEVYELLAGDESDEWEDRIDEQDASF